MLKAPDNKTAARANQPPKVKKLLYMEREYADALEITSQLEGVSQSEILRRALAEYFKNYDRKRIKVFAEKAKALDRFKKER